MSYHAPNLPRRKHCFFGSEGGCSEGFYNGLNVNTKSDDDKDNLAFNLDEAASFFRLDSSRLHLLNQGVSADVEYVDEPTQDIMRADGVVTDRPDIILCIRTADCAPVLLADYEHGVVGAAHAGWRGALNGVIENTIDLMTAKGAKLENIAAAVGPCIGQNSYEVDEGFYHQFVGKDISFGRFFAAGKPGHFQFDLEAFCKSCLENKGIADISVSGLDTYALANRYYSFRRFTHQNLIKKPKCFPTELSAIVL